MNHIYITYKNIAIPHGRHIYAKAYDMANATICPYPQSDHALPHWKCVMKCCPKCPCINISDQETDNQHSDKTTSIRSYSYHLITRGTSHWRNPLKDKTLCRMCKQESSSENSTKIYTIKELVMMETTISYFRTSFYILAIQRLAFHLPHLLILGTNKFSALWHTAFKRCELFQDVICLPDYDEGVVTIIGYHVK